MNRRARLLGTSLCLAVLLPVALSPAAQAQGETQTAPPAAVNQSPPAEAVPAAAGQQPHAAPARRPVRRVHRAPRRRPAEQSDTQAYVPPPASITIPAPAPQAAYPPNSSPAPVPNRDLEAPRVVQQDTGPRVAPSFISPRISERFGAAAEGEVYRRDRMSAAPGARLTVPFEYNQ